MNERIAMFFWDSENGFSRIDALSQALAIIDDEILKMQSDSSEGSFSLSSANTKIDLALFMKMKSGVLLLQAEVKRLREEYHKIAVLAEQEKIPKALADSAVKLEAHMNQATLQLFWEVRIIINELNERRQRGIFGWCGANTT